MGKKAAASPAPWPPREGGMAGAFSGKVGTGFPRENATSIAGLAAGAALLGALAFAPGARAEATTLRVAKQFGIAYLQFMVMEDQKMIERQAKAAGLGDINVDFAQFRSSDVMNDALLSASVD